MEENYITRQEHNEFSLRMEAENQRLKDEDRRQNRRLDALENAVNQMNALTVSVERMAVNMENMLTAIERQGNLIENQNNRLDEIEKEPAKDSKQIKMTIINTIIGAFAGAIAAGILTLLK